MALTIINTIINVVSLGFQVRMDFMQTISPSMFIEGGIGAFLMHKINQKIDTWGVISRIPLLIIEDRDFDILWDILRAKNNADEVSPCPSIITSLPIMDFCLYIIRLVNIIIM